MSDHYAIKMMLGGAGALIAFCLDAPSPTGLTDDRTVNGNGKEGAGLDCALALFSEPTVNGIGGQLNVFRWEIYKTTIEGRQVFTIYRLPGEDEWIVDNKIPRLPRVGKLEVPMQTVYLMKEAP